MGVQAKTGDSPLDIPVSSLMIYNIHIGCSAIMYKCIKKKDGRRKNEKKKSTKKEREKKTKSEFLAGIPFDGIGFTSFDQCSSFPGRILIVYTRRGFWL